MVYVKMREKLGFCKEFIQIALPPLGASNTVTKCLLLVLPMLKY